jgi:hypothetical protein
MASLIPKPAPVVLAAALAGCGGAEAVAATSGRSATHAGGHTEDISVVPPLDNHGLNTGRHGTGDVTVTGGASHPASHGGCVSVVARSDATTGEAHGDATAAVAKNDCGKVDRRDQRGG